MRQIAKDMNEWARKRDQLGEFWWEIKPWEGSLVDLERKTPTLEDVARRARLKATIEEQKNG